LKNAKSLIEWIAWAEPQYDFNPMIDEWCKEAPKELDFNREAGSSPCSGSLLICFSIHAPVSSFHQSHGLVSSEGCVFIMYGYLIVENTRIVSRNLGQKTDSGSGSVSSAVDVMIPEVIQVFCWFYFSCIVCLVLMFFLEIMLPFSDWIFFCVSVNGQDFNFAIYGWDSLK
jgi:aarF domain-containing kinase